MKERCARVLPRTTAAVVGRTRHPVLPCNLPLPPTATAADALEGQPDSLELALQLEAAVWQEVDAVHALASKLRDRSQPLPAGLACLRPMQAQAQQQAQQQAGAPPDYPALRRLHHLANATTSMLANVSATEGRQAWVEAGSLCARLRLGLAALRKHRQVLAAVVAVEGL